MSQETIDVVGTTRFHEYPKCIDKSSCKQIMENDHLCLPCQKPDIESVLQVYVDVKVKCFKVIKTILGKKVIIEGIKKIKIMYVADEPTQSVHSAHWDIHFCEFILLKEHPKCNNKKYVSDVFIGIEESMVTNIEKRCVDICNLLILCPVIEHKHFPESNCHEEEENYPSDEQDNHYENHDCHHDRGKVCIKHDHLCDKEDHCIKDDCHYNNHCKPEPDPHNDCYQDDMRGDLKGWYKHKKSKAW